jgi:hypothetical protein
MTTPADLARIVATLTPDQLGSMDHATLYAMRQYLQPQQQNLVAPYEHRAFAREEVTQHPLMALPVAAGALAYQPYKMLMGARSDPSFNQMGQGLLGVGEGLKKNFTGLLDYL